ncbi:hypothetical protein Poly51_59980 [Rubripirellula tenax]|uniref:Knr4/Smi1-like domain-containing protein n=1 Tax=Rubripirellula tenax TaxID=2528015 RepID=A0A5C6EC55_9BACT|nr:SMI1/KNR4 family protein [Rubripirellula tenax]TWU44729.1 hypothetical protein Poly51_59980 [Rubripirellula tenax]
MLTTVSEWTEFFGRYRKRSSELLEREEIEVFDSTWLAIRPASEAAVDATQDRLGVHFPPDLFSFYLTCNGWPADSWYNPAINCLADLDWLEKQNPGLHKLVSDAATAQWPGRQDDDPDLVAYRLEQGTQVMRTIAITFDHDDQPTVLLDPESDWRLGSWLHSHPAMLWTDGGFSEYMIDRYENLILLDT